MWKLQEKQVRGNKNPLTHVRQSHQSQQVYTETKSETLIAERLEVGTAVWPVHTTYVKYCSAVGPVPAMSAVGPVPAMSAVGPVSVVSC
jgi:hypothetical protein